MDIKIPRITKTTEVRSAKVGLGFTLTGSILTTEQMASIMCAMRIIQDSNLEVYPTVPIDCDEEEPVGEGEAK